ncbi:MAG: hypothetical protein WBW92_11030, partial [Rhodanobacteraceae bacterium]
ACQDVVAYNGQKWARFAANFTTIDQDGKVNFDIHDKAQNNRFITNVTFDPRPGQVVYINNGTIAFDQLKTTDVVNLHVPGRGYGFSAQPGVEAENLTLVSPQPRADPDPVSDTSLASSDTAPAMLPQTASVIPLLALAGLLSLLGGLGLSLRRVL